MYAIEASSDIIPVSDIVSGMEKHDRKGETHDSEADNSVQGPDRLKFE